MDTHIVYPGQIPQDTDLLLAQKLAALGVGGLGDVLYGRTAAAWGFSPTLSSTALTVTIGAGVILASGAILPTALGGEGGGLPADATVTTKQYLLPSAQTLTFPGTGGTYTLYALCSDVDTDNTLLPFWSADNPTQTQAGPNNAGTQLATRRTSQVVLTLAQSAPAAPANGSVIPLMTFTVPSGATNASGVTYSQIANTFWLTIPELQAAIAAIAPGRLLNKQSFTNTNGETGTSGTYTVPAGVNTIIVKGVAAGGAGGGSQDCLNTSNASAGSSGGAGSYFEARMPVTPGQKIPYFIPAGGVGATAANGADGSALTFGPIGDLGTLSAPGGLGGYKGGIASSSGAALVTNAPAVGLPTGPDIVFSQQGEQGSPGVAVLGQAVAFSGGSSAMGSGGVGRVTYGTSNQYPGGDGQGWGAGGGAHANIAGTQNAGGAGADGYLLIEEYS